MIFFQVISFGVVAFTAALFSFFVLSSGCRDKISRSFAIASFYVAIWGFLLVLWHLTENGEIALILLQAGMIFAALIPVGFENFVIRFTEPITGKIYKISRIITFFFGSLFSLLFLTDMFGWTALMAPSVQAKLWFPYWPNAGPLYGFFLAYFFGTFIYAFYLLYKVIKVSPDEKVRSQARIILFGTAIAMLGGSTNYFLWYSVPIPPLGTILVPIYVISMFYATTKYRLFNIKVVAAQLITFIIWSFLFIRIFFAKSVGEFTTDIVLLTLVIVFGIFLIKSVLNEVKRKEELQIITKELRGLTNHLQEKVDEQTREIRRAYEVEKKARTELEELAETKSRFIMDTQEQLKAPLNIIKESLKLLKNFSLSAEASETVSRVSDSSSRLDDLISEFIAISGIQVGKESLRKSLVDIKSLIEEVVRNFSTEIQSKHIAVTFIFPKNNNVSIDRSKMMETLTNLIDNAVKYNKEEGKIRIEGERTKHPIERDKEIYKLTIEDTGIGMTKEELAHLFTQYFERGEEAQKLYTTGRGIGLAVVKNIISAHDGRIYAESYGRGKGSKFVVELIV